MAFMIPFDPFTGVPTDDAHHRSVRALAGELKRLDAHVPKAHTEFFEQHLQSATSAFAMMDLMASSQDEAKELMIRSQTQVALQVVHDLLAYLHTDKPAEGALCVAPDASGLEDARQSLARRLEMRQYSTGRPSLPLLDTAPRARDWMRHVREYVLGPARMTSVSTGVRGVLLGMAQQDLSAMYARLAQAYACLYQEAKMDV